MSTTLKKERAELRTASYNATLLESLPIHDDLRIFRVQPDWEIPPFASGQYVALGLGYWEPRLPGTQLETLRPAQQEKLVRRAYSISCSMLDPHGKLVRAQDCDYFEFYITLVRQAAKPPALTPRLFMLREGDRLFIEPHIVGHYALDGIERDDQVVFFATGTGEAPHNAMIVDLLSRGHSGTIVCATCVRHRRDLASLTQRRKLETCFSNYRYLPLTTREPENANPSLPNYVGKMYLQEYVTSGHFERESGILLDPQRTHIFLCGSPDMIGYRAHSRTGKSPFGMLQVLKQRGFDHTGLERPGKIRFEKYW
jgi:ferredoxin--NADP+ reductase